MCAIDAERGLAVWPTEAAPARALTVLAGAIITVDSVALERASARAASVDGLEPGDKPRGGLRVHRVHPNDEGKPEAGSGRRKAGALPFRHDAGRPRLWHSASVI